MSRPIVLSTWSFGSIANAAAWPVLRDGGAALDAVEVGCRAVEADATQQSVGLGGRPDRSGEVSLDASIMASPSQAGAVCYVRRHLHAVSLARAVMEKTQHVMLAGEGADRFADALDMPESDLLTDDSRQAWQRWCERHPRPAADPTVAHHPRANIEEDHDTVGVLALDAQGRLAGACSTSGIAYKVPGRVGDSPIIGHGLYVHPRYGAAVATGHGELVMGVCGTFAAVDRMRRGAKPLDALVEILQMIVDENDLHADAQVGMIVLTPDGEYATGALRRGYTTAIRTAELDQHIEPDTILL